MLRRSNDTLNDRDTSYRMDMLRVSRLHARAMASSQHGNSDGDRLAMFVRLRCHVGSLFRCFEGRLWLADQDSNLE